MPLTEIEKLRVSMARIAQALGVDNELKVTGAPYERLVELARQERGWNNLAEHCADRASRLADEAAR